MTGVQTCALPIWSCNHDYDGQGEEEMKKPTKAQAKVKKVMHEFKTGALHTGSKKGPVVKSRKQAIAIALSEAGKSKRA
mgnify:CR=1 FL=1